MTLLAAPPHPATPAACPEGNHFVLSLPAGGNGLRVAIKDTIDIAGLPTRAGSRAFEAVAPAPRNADVVEALLRGGAVIVGKANMHELAFGVTGVNGWTGTPVNPRYPGFVPGGSSSGSATAVAAGLADLALGTDTGGSIRIPAACCGIIGFKPSFGRLSRRGLTPAESSLDCVGPLARDIATLQRAMAMLDATFQLPTLGTPRIGILRGLAEPALDAAVRAALEGAGCTLVAVELPGMEAAFRAGMAIMNAEMLGAFGGLLETGALGADIAGRLKAARMITLEQLADAEAVRGAFTAAVDAALVGLDALAMPTIPGAPVRLAEAADSAAALAMTRLVRPFNLSGHPALSLPLSNFRQMPAGLQLVALRGDDARLCAVAGWVAGQSPHVLRHSA
ncbi:amidase [Roseomonas sp. GC11]|uniref:amidase n=1 Tax=Roseomonas sp. GC11 TaxID=2950546 RepID=UPI00210AE7BD|nr:amidase [Roseomonas sp. GC11]MCQ4159883.1 amidase [Roseomonas sp. GC11]